MPAAVLPSAAGAILAGAAVLGILHGLIPSHWLSFVAIGRARRWNVSRTLGVAALAGTAHLILTVLLGIGLALFGHTLLKHIALPPLAEQLAAALTLIGLGIVFLVQAARHGCTHDHEHGTAGMKGSDRAVIGALLLGMLLSPCLDILPLYAAAALLPLPMLLAIGGLFIALTLITMLTLIRLTMLGLNRFRSKKLERYEGYIVGCVLIVVGASLFFIK